ncbi:MAG: GTP-binding protein TypA [Elusimicrobia bacterium RIFCSPLOWO2_01_FULL_64_13]|nr:MAG: GTP-binding protein TypA [Elusimicrobia bacterium RIFCSPLOWO2_01_FULL_64_13]
MEEKHPIRNVAIIAHVDHGKTTLVDAILRQTQVQRNIQDLGERIMDSMDLERERGITIRAKNASVVYNGVKINIVDTPGHADFGGEVERILRMVDGVLLLVDAKDGPMPQTRFVLRKALELGLRAIVVINKIDRPEAMPEKTVNETFDLFCELHASEAQLDFPIVYTSAVNGTATLDLQKPCADIFPLLDTILQRVPEPEIHPDSPLQILTLSLFADAYKGNLGIGKITGGKIRVGDAVLACKKNGTRVPFRVMSLLTYQGLKRAEVREAFAGDIVAVAGLDEIGIGDTLTDPEDPDPLPPPVIDEPTVQMTFGVNTSPFAGREGKYVTSRVLRERLFKELETNVSLRVAETDSTDSFLVSGRGELHLAVLIETMRREGYELQVSRPEVIFHEKEGARFEPYEFLMVDVPSEYQGVVIEALGRRRGSLKKMQADPAGGMHFEYQVPTRGVIGLKGALMTLTRGLAVMHHVFDEYLPVDGKDVNEESHGSLVSMENGTTTAYALDNAQERGALFVGPGVDVYLGMIVGECSRGDDMNINPCKGKKLTNMRASGSDDAAVLTPPREMTLELAIETIGPDELVEVTPESIRLRKKVLNPSLRKKSRIKSE